MLNPSTITVPHAAQLLGVSPTGAYAAIRGGTFPTPAIKIGRGRYVIPTRPLLDLLGIEELPPLDVPSDADEDQDANHTPEAA